MGRLAYVKEPLNKLKILVAGISVTSEDPAYTRNNLVAMPTSFPFRTLSGDISSQAIEFDLGSAKQLDIVTITNHNFSPTVSITLRAGSSPTPDGSQFEETIPYQSRRTLLKRFTPATWQYWRLDITDTNNDYGYLQLGHVLGGELIELSSYFKFGWNRIRQSSKGGVVSDTGSPIAVISRGQWEGAEVTFETRSDSERTELDSFLQSLRGEEVGLLLLPDSEKAEAFIGRLRSDYTMSQTQSFITQFSPLLFTEDSVGVNIPAGNLFL